VRGRRPEEISIEPELPQSTVYFDGSCPLCRAEVGYYRRKDQDRALCFVDISEAGAVPPESVTQERAMRRFHVRASDGRVLSGAAAFVEVWTRLPRWRWAARAASLPGALVALEWGYRFFLPLRPFISRLFGRVLRLQAVRGGAKR
jgi:predicted DCC family thiol-disulfide oxidoreductase YuxK